MGDYPDYTDLVQLIGTDIMVPMDIQASYIMLPVDIQAQYATLEIDIVAQSVGNIAIDLAAQSIGNIAVDINAQTIEKLDIDIKAQTVGVYLQPDWAAKEGTDKQFQAAENNIEYFDAVLDSYTVPTGKTLFITTLSCESDPSNIGDAQKRAQLSLSVHNSSTGKDVFEIGCDGGGCWTLTKPVSFSAGTLVLFCLQNLADHKRHLRIHVYGYEI
jgi:hypothetical protein